MSVLIFANGELEPKDWVRAYLEKATALIAADGGVQHLLALGHMPDVVIGDLDSLKPDVRDAMREAKVKVIVHPEMKDESDLELALRYAVEHCEGEILLFGALGGRLDQLLANVFLLNSPFMGERSAKIVEAFQEAWIMDKGENQIRGEIGDRVSLLPLGGDAQIRRTTGLAWPLKDEALLQGMSRGISNRLTAERATIEIDTGMLLCVHLDSAWPR